MSSRRLAVLFASVVFTFLGATAAPAQETTIALAPCVSDWGCGAVRPPLGFYVDTVSDDGRYVTLEDGTIWEVQHDHRAAVAGWQREEFIAVRHVAAPTGDYEWQFTKVGHPEWRAAVRLAGRVQRPVVPDTSAQRQE